MKILEVVTEHTGPIKILFEVLKEMLLETTIEFIAEDMHSNKNKKKDFDSDDSSDDENSVSSKKKSKKKSPKKDNSSGNSRSNIEKKKSNDGLKIVAIDSTKNVLINLKLEAENFTRFVCKKKKLNIGINLTIFYKLIKSIGKNDIITLYLEHDDLNHLGIKLDNIEEKKDSVIKLKLLDLQEETISIPAIAFDAIIHMNSQEFHRLCRDMIQIAEYVEIKCLADKIIFTCKGDSADKAVTYRNNPDINSTTASGNASSENAVQIKLANKNNDNGPQIVQGVFELKNLVLFSKCSSLCNEIEIFMKNDYPLVIKYSVATLGRILLCLTPINQDNNKNDLSDGENCFSSDSSESEE